MYGKSINFPLFYLKYLHRHNQMIQFLCGDGSDSDKDKEEMIEVEAIQINVSDSSGDEYFPRLYLIII